MTKESLYFVAIVLPELLAAEVRTFQQLVAEEFGSHAALRSPPHITLLPPFRFNVENLHSVSDLLSLCAATSAPCRIALRGFGAFGKRVIFVHVEPSATLSALSAVLSASLAESGISLRDTHRPYHPHVTLAYKDLTQEGFREAWRYFDGMTFDRVFVAMDIVLLVHRDGRWEEVRGYGFGG